MYGATLTVFYIFFSIRYPDTTTARGIDSRYAGWADSVSGPTDFEGFLCLALELIMKPSGVERSDEWRVGDPVLGQRFAFFSLELTC